MTLGFDQKEDLRLRMMELEKKLAESEEERSKLEKTCNVLIRVFQEEEKMHYRALSKKYEKFLEDCDLRKRRNDIILRSLCRIEDRAKTLLAKTERLKVLKDRYISYLKICDLKKIKPVLPLKNFPYVSPSRKISQDVIPKFVHWKSSYVSEAPPSRKIEDDVELKGSLFYKSNSTGEIFLSKQSFENNFTSDRMFSKEQVDSVKSQNLEHKSFSKECINASDGLEKSEKSFQNCEAQRTLMNFENASLSARDNKYNGIYNSPIAQNTNLKKDLTSPEIANREIRLVENLINQPEKESFEEVAVRREKVAVTHQESIEKLKKVLSIEEDDKIENDLMEETQKIIEKDEIEMNEKSLAQKNKALNEESNRLVISNADKDIYNKSNNDAVNLQSNHFDQINEDKVAKNLPVGLDGVDYQNETYPESYYEQPFHQNHTSIASDVILEEDESEQDTDQDISNHGAKNFLVRNSGSEYELSFIKGINNKTNQPREPNLEKQSLNFPNNNNIYDETEKFQDAKGPEAKFKIDNTDVEDQSKKSDDVINSEKNPKRTLQSNLMHLLESDSESCQIEHGDLATGNEDSDFDFSFNQN